MAIPIDCCTVERVGQTLDGTKPKQSIVTLQKPDTEQFGEKYTDNWIKSINNGT